MVRRSFTIVLGLSVLACTTSPTTRPPGERIIAVDERTGSTIKGPSDNTGLRTVFPAPADKVWDAVASSYLMLKVDRTLVNQATGEQGNRKLTMSRTFDRQRVSTFLNCGDDPFGGPNADSGPVTASLISRVTAQGSGTVLETHLSGMVTKVGANSGAIHCASTGALETHISRMVASRLTP